MSEKKYSTANAPRTHNALVFDCQHGRELYSGDGYCLSELAVAFAVQGVRGQDALDGAICVAKLIASGLSKAVLFDLLPTCAVRDVGTANPQAVRGVLHAIKTWKDQLTLSKQPALAACIKEQRKQCVAWQCEGAAAAVLTSAISMCMSPTNDRTFAWFNVSSAFTEMAPPAIWPKGTTGWASVDALLFKLAELPDDYPAGAKEPLADAVTYRERELIRWAAWVYTAMSHLSASRTVSDTKIEWKKRWMSVDAVYLGRGLKETDAYKQLEALRELMVHHDAYDGSRSSYRKYAWIAAVMQLATAIPAVAVATATAAAAAAVTTAAAAVPAPASTWADANIATDSFKDVLKFAVAGLLAPDKLAFSNRELEIGSAALSNYHQKRGRDPTEDTTHKLRELHSKCPTASITGGKESWSANWPDEEQKRSAGKAPATWLIEQKTQPCSDGYLVHKTVETVPKWQRLTAYSTRCLRVQYKAVKDEIAERKVRRPMYEPMVDRVTDFTWDTYWEHKGGMAEFSKRFGFPSDAFMEQTLKRRGNKKASASAASAGDDDISDLKNAAGSDGDEVDADAADAAANERFRLDKLNRKHGVDSKSSATAVVTATAAATPVPSSIAVPPPPPTALAVALAAAAASNPKSSNKRKASAAVGIEPVTMTLMESVIPLADVRTEYDSIMKHCGSMTYTGLADLSSYPVTQRPNPTGIITRLGPDYTYTGPYLMTDPKHIQYVHYQLGVTLFHSSHNLICHTPALAVESEPGQIHRVWLVGLTIRTTRARDWTLYYVEPTTEDPYRRSIPVMHTMGVRLLTPTAPDSPLPAEWPLAVVESQLLVLAHTTGGAVLRPCTVSRDFYDTKENGVWRRTFSFGEPPVVVGGGSGEKKAKRSSVLPWREALQLNCTPEEEFEMERSLRHYASKTREVLRRFKVYAKAAGAIASIELLLEATTPAVTAAAAAVAPASSSSSAAAASSSSA